MKRRPTAAELNDLLRTTFATGRVMLTEGIRALPPPVLADVLARVRGVDDFTAENDPYGEHDFGAFDDDGAGRVFWKIDHYDPSMTLGSDDPADPDATMRVLTVMLAEEY